MTTTASTASKFCARSRSECSNIFFLDLKSGIILGNLGLNVNPKDLGCEVRNLETKSVLGPFANFAKCETFISRGE